MRDNEDSEQDLKIAESAAYLLDESFVIVLRLFLHLEHDRECLQYDRLDLIDWRRLVVFGMAHDKVLPKLALLAFIIVALDLWRWRRVEQHLLEAVLGQSALEVLVHHKDDAVAAIAQLLAKSVAGVDVTVAVERCD